MLSIAEDPLRERVVLRTSLVTGRAERNASSPFGWLRGHFRVEWGIARNQIIPQSNSSNGAARTQKL